MRRRGNLQSTMAILTLMGVYLLAGGVFGVAFWARGYAAIAPEARGASPAARLLWTPAAALLWPLLAGKWRRAVKSAPAGG